MPPAAAEIGPAAAVVAAAIVTVRRGLAGIVPGTGRSGPIRAHDPAPGRRVSGARLIMIVIPALGTDRTRCTEPHSLGLGLSLYFCDEPDELRPDFRFQRRRNCLGH